MISAQIAALSEASNLEYQLCTSQPPQAPRVNLCSICKMVANFLKTFVNSNSSEVSELFYVMCHKEYYE